MSEYGHVLAFVIDDILIVQVFGFLGAKGGNPSGAEFVCKCSGLRAEGGQTFR
jgi:hypothetical protein